MLLLMMMNASNNGRTRQTYLRQVAQLSQRHRAGGWVSYDQKWKTETERQYFTDFIGLPSTTVT